MCVSLWRVPTPRVRVRWLVTCLHCDKQVVITIPRVYIEADALVRGLTSRLMPQ
jgi:hypothetical protein